MDRKLVVIQAWLSGTLLVVLASIFSVMTFHLAGAMFDFILVCIIAAFVYAFSLGLARSSPGFWKGLVTLLIVFAIAQTIAETVYVWKMDAIHDDAIESLAVAAWYLAASMAVGIAWYSAGYWASRAIMGKGEGKGGKAGQSAPG